MPPLPTPTLYGTAADTATDTAWVEWTNVTTAANTITVWLRWTDSTATPIIDNFNRASPNNFNYMASPPISDEERARQQREYDERRAKAREAQERAKALLTEHLNGGQRKDFEKHGYFYVVTRNGRRWYRFKPGCAPIRIRGEDGLRWSYCIHPNGSYPSEDVALAQKLLLETDEEQFLRIANATRVYG